MNIDHILRTFNANEVEYLLIGGMNFLLRHEPVLTYAIDFWIRDTAANLGRCDTALRQLNASWGPTEDSWRPVAEQSGWLDRQSVFCLTSPVGAIDIFRAVTGLPSWEACRESAVVGQTATGVEYRGLCDEDMTCFARRSTTAGTHRGSPAGNVDVESTRSPDMTQTTNATGGDSAHDPADRAAREHERRERAWQPAARWLAIQETIRWAESQATARRNTPQSCIERDRRIREAVGPG